MLRIILLMMSFLMASIPLALAQPLAKSCEMRLQNERLYLSQYKKLKSASFIATTHYPKIYYVAEQDSINNLAEYIKGHTVSRNDLLAAMYVATQEHNLRMMKYLVRRGTPVNGETPTGGTPLLNAIACDFTKGADFLMGKSANVNEPKNSVGTFNLALVNENFYIARKIIYHGYQIDLTRKRCLASKRILKLNQLTMPRDLAKKIADTKCY